MKVRIDRTRMAMDGCFYSYDCLVPVSEIDREKFNYFVCRDGQQYVTFADAKRPAELDLMPRGVARYDAFMAHSRAAEFKAWEAIQSAFPEVANMPKSSLFLEVPGFDASHKTVYSEVR